MKSIDSIDWSDLFQYDPTSPSGLRRKKEWRTGSNLRILRAKVGDVAGSKNKLGYYSVKVDDVIYLCHRIVVALSGKRVDGLFVDHIDQDPTNNRLENLRITGPAENSRNRRLPATSTSGVVGVGENWTTSTSGKKHKRWRAEVHINGKKKCKFFSVSVHGEAEAFRLACEWRAKMIEELNRQGAGYTEKHGT